MTELGRAASRDIAAKLSPSDVENLVAFLASHKDRDLDETIKLAPAPVLPYSRIVSAKAEPQNWPTYWGDFRAIISANWRNNARQCRHPAGSWVGPMLGENFWNPRPSWWTG